MCDCSKLYERVHDNRLRNIVSISEEQFGFVKGKSPTDAIVALRQLQQIYREGQQGLHCVFIDLKMHTTGSRGKNSIGRPLHARQGVPEKYIILVKDVYNQCEMRCAPATSEPFAVEVGLHQGSAFRHFLAVCHHEGFSDRNFRKKHVGR